MLGPRQPEDEHLGSVVSREIYDEGKAAKVAGKPDGANPYEAGSQQSLDWLEGYTAGEPEPSALGPNEDE